MTNLTKNFFYSLSQSKLLNESAKKWGFKFGADKFVAGTDLDSVTKTIKILNHHGISGTVDNLGEFVTDREEAIRATNNIIHLLKRMNEENLDCHVSVKLTQLGLGIDEQFCLDNMRRVMETASSLGIFVNIDMEDYSSYEQTIRIFQTLRKEFENVGTVIQAYLYRAEEDLEQLKDARIRLVKGAYKESEAVAYQSKAEIDRNYLKLAKKRLLGDAFTSIATHDHNIINELKAFIKENNISHDKFEFQMLYGFRTELQYSLAAEGYRFCTYIPFGTDWFGYYMRRLAERPQNINLIVKDVFYDSDNKLKKKPLVVAAGAATIFCLLRKRKNREK